MKRRIPFAVALVAAFGSIALQAAAAAPRAAIRVQADGPGTPIARTMHGLFFEDINYAADGGLYAELIQNRSFEHRDALWAWNETARGGAQGRLAAEDEAPLNGNNRNFLRIYVSQPSAGYGVINPGFDGIRIRPGETYLFSVYTRRRAGDRMELRVALETSDGSVLAEGRVGDIGRGWSKRELKLKSSGATADGRLALLAGNEGVVDVDMVSLFPEKTFKGRRNGLRADLAQALADVHPGFMRFPGGCVVEGRDFDNMYRWKDTIGDVAERKQNWNLWQDRVSPQYHQTYGLGFLEYFQFCEDIGAEPVPVLNCGMCCQARGGRHVPLDQLAPYVQDALDLVEFANGPAESGWGARRAALGHPKPFHLKFLGIGNEQWNQEYFDRYDLFYRALKAKHPEIRIITTSGPHPDDALWRFAWNKFRSGTPAEIVDEHYYRPPQWFLDNCERYDVFDRKGPKIFAGEYAAHDAGRRNNLRSAVAEAVHITSLWRNADLVLMSAYAPLLAKDRHFQWRPNLIWFDNNRISLTPSYHVQAMAGRNLPGASLPLKVEAPLIDPPVYAGRIGIGTWRTQAEFKEITVTQGDRVLFRSDFSNGYAGWDTHGGNWSVVDGALRQTSEDENVRAFTGDPAWTDYTLSLKARKIAGAEGFLIGFAVREGEVPTWNIAGWNNTQHGLEVAGAARPFLPGRVETDRWYDIRIEVKGPAVKCHLDGRLVQEAACQPTRGLYAAAGRDAGSGEIILAIANPNAAPMSAAIELAGLGQVKTGGKAIVLTSASPNDENSLDQPGKVAPREEPLRANGPKFEHSFPGWSFSVLRVQPGGR